MESLKCPSCGSPLLTKIDNNEYKCQNCSTAAVLSNDQKYLVIQQGYPCPSCNFINESGVKFCGNCGGFLVKYCKNCSNEVRLEIKFCSKCGESSFESSIVNIVLKRVRPQNRISVATELRQMLGLDVKEAYRCTESPTVIYKNLGHSDAMVIKARLEKAGAQIEFINSHL